MVLTGGKIVMLRLAGLWKECVVAYFLYIFTTFAWKYCVRSRRHYQKSQSVTLEIQTWYFENKKEP